MISKLILCYELSLEELQETINFLATELKTHEILCLKVEELSLVNLEDYSIYCFHFNLNNELKTHSQVSSWLLKNDYNLLNPYLDEANIFDNKYLFSQFMSANQVLHPETFLAKNYDEKFESGYIVKPCHGTEKRDFADYSRVSFEKILGYDEVIVQRKIDIHKEIKVLSLNDNFYSDQVIDYDLKEAIYSLNEQIQEYLFLKNSYKVSIYSIDIIQDKDFNYYFVELNLRPNALYRFKEKFDF